MMRKNSGVTMVTLVITVIILFMLTGIGISGTYESITETKNNKYTVELGIVRQAITEQYMKATAVNRLNVSTNQSQIEFWVGTPLTSFSNDILPEKSSLNLDVNEDEINDFYDLVNNYDVNDYDYQEELYYELLPEDLKEIGISDAKDTYIVNYQTKEIYNESKKVNGNNELLYLPGNTQ